MGFPAAKGAKIGGAKGFAAAPAKGGFKSVRPTIGKGPAAGGFKGKVAAAAPSFKGASKGSYAAPKGTFASAKGGVKASPKGVYARPAIGVKGSFASSAVTSKGYATKASPIGAKGGFASPKGVKGSFASSFASPKGVSAKGKPAFAKGGFASPVKGVKGSFDSSFASSKGKSFIGKGKDAGKGKGKDKGKKGKVKAAPPADDPFWEEKAAAENREATDDNLYTGTVNGWNELRGWGFILPEDATMMPEDVQEFLEGESQKAAEKQAAKGKSKGDEPPPALLYFRRPDCADGYKPEKEQTVMFQLYKDDKGFGACEVQAA